MLIAWLSVWKYLISLERDCLAPTWAIRLVLACAVREAKKDRTLI